MKLKKEVNSEGVSREIWFALGVAESVYTAHGMQLIVTSLNDGHTDRPTSLHNLGRAADCRTRDLPRSTIEIIFNEIKATLEPLGFDTVHHLPGGSVPEHIHIEFDPKVGELFLRREV